MAESVAGRPRILRSLLLIVVLLGAGIGLGSLMISLGVEPPRRVVSADAPLVEAVVVRAEDVVERFRGYGSAQCFHRANVASEVAATVVECVNEIRVGSAVKKGDVLIRLDDRQYRHAFDRAEALAQAEEASLVELAIEAASLERLIAIAQQELRVNDAERIRVTDLFERGQAAKKEFDFATLAYQGARRVLEGYQRDLEKTAPRRARLEAGVRGYRAEADLARLNLERCEIRAPFSGRIESLHVDVGDRVSPGIVVAALVDATRVELPIQLPASVYNRVRVGADCQLAIEGATDTRWYGEVARIAPVADERTRTFSVYVVVDNRSQRQPLVPGTFVTAEVLGPVHTGGILVPRRAVRDGRVLVFEDGVARQRSINRLLFIEDHLLVGDELADGDRVIVSHLDKLTDGSPVRLRAEVSTEAHAGPATTHAGGEESSP